MIHIDQFVIKGDWDTEPTPEGKSAILMPPIPNGIHGGGWHRSTKATLRAVIAHMEPGMTFFDLGTGTGIIGVAAHLLGASKIYACEHEPKAVEFARKVFGLNGVEVAWVTDYPQVDLCVANVGRGGLEITDFNPGIMVSVDGHGHSARIVDGMPLMTIPVDTEAPLRVLQPGHEQTLYEAARDVLAHHLGIKPEKVCGTEGETVTLSFGATMLAARGWAIQSALDLQFGPGRVKVQP